MTSFLAVDPARCTHEAIDDEILVLDTLTGCLLILGGCGVQVWERFVGGAAPEALLAGIGAAYSAEAADDVRQFIDKLVAEGLVVAGAESEAADAPAFGPVEWPDTYAAPTLERHDEIAAIMTMDPIHEVDVDKGWPAAQTSGDQAIQ